MNVVAAEQEDISKIFAGQIKDQQVSFGRLADMPIILDTLVQVACDVSADHVERDLK
ncbi:flavin reductase family protein [Peribacillus loiseleuriae]|uniref:flavin reductase family protein n=1 Tax=Peribacillus loiseleuriae TaxID=1679170 RepID=UPI003D042D9C